jgi:hypothetical protein
MGINGKNAVLAYSRGTRRCSLAAAERRSILTKGDGDHAMINIEQIVAQNGEYGLPHCFRAANPTNL